MQADEGWNDHLSKIKKITNGKHILRRIHSQKSDGTKVSKEELEKILYSPGDGVVAKRSLISSLLETRRVSKQQEEIKNLTVACGEHNRLTNEETIGTSILSVLNLTLEGLSD